MDKGFYFHAAQDSSLRLRSFEDESTSAIERKRSSAEPLLALNPRLSSSRERCDRRILRGVQTKNSNSPINHNLSYNNSTNSVGAHRVSPLQRQTNIDLSESDITRFTRSDIVHK